MAEKLPAQDFSNRSEMRIKMIQDIAPKVFDNSYKDKRPAPDDILLVFRGDRKDRDEILCLVEEGKVALPKLRQTKVDTGNCRYLFSIDDTSYFLYEKDDFDDQEIAGFSFASVRTLRKNEPVDVCFAGMTAYHLYVWYRDNRFCGRCGHPVIHDTKERMLRCPDCGNMIFPKIAPAVIIGLIYGDAILISTYAGRAYKGRALLAGFCEIGETPEETVEREVYEEVGLKVKNIRYYDSQPWGFDSNLLLGYFCEVDGDTNITMDAEELATAAFVKRDDIEPDPNLLSLTATMIEVFRKGGER